MIILKTSATISDDFANVIKFGKYEEIIYELSPSLSRGMLYLLKTKCNNMSKINL